MSLISSRNFVSPLTNKVHVITIVMVVAAFGIFRASGGKVSANSATDTRTPVRVEAIRPAIPVRQPVTAQKVEPANEPAKPAAQPDKGDDSLSDIEASLGLR